MVGLRKRKKVDYGEAGRQDDPYVQSLLLCLFLFVCLFVLDKEHSWWLLNELVSIEGEELESFA